MPPPCCGAFLKGKVPQQPSHNHRSRCPTFCNTPKNRWDSLDQEILISTPRRFGKTISVSMFAAALIFSCPNVECSIYSTCKRISQKLLRNIYKFLELIYAELGVPHYRIIRYNMEEIVLRGPESDTDVRVVNSYPSKVIYYNYEKYIIDVNPV